MPYVLWRYVRHRTIKYLRDAEVMLIECPLSMI